MFLAQTSRWAVSCEATISRKDVTALGIPGVERVSTVAADVGPLCVFVDFLDMECQGGGVGVFFAAGVALIRFSVVFQSVP